MLPTFNSAAAHMAIEAAFAAMVPPGRRAYGTRAPSRRHRRLKAAGWDTGRRSPKRKGRGR